MGEVNDNTRKRKKCINKTKLAYLVNKAGHDYLERLNC